MQKNARRARPWALAAALILPLALGALSAILTRDGMALFRLMRKPPLTPPTWAFPAAWTVLYILMGLASYLVYVSGSSRVRRGRALSFYGLQLAMNFFWPIIFFALEMYLTAFVWLVGMWVLIVICAVLFYHIDTRAGGLMLPYIIWTAFAGYLNIGVYLLNR